MISQLVECETMVNDQHTSAATTATIAITTAAETTTTATATTTATTKTSSEQLYITTKTTREDIRKSRIIVTVSFVVVVAVAVAVSVVVVVVVVAVSPLVDLFGPLIGWIILHNGHRLSTTTSTMPTTMTVATRSAPPMPTPFITAVYQQQQQQ